MSGGGTAAALNANVVGSANVTDNSLTASDLGTASVGSDEAAALDAGDVATGSFAKKGSRVLVTKRLATTLETLVLPATRSSISTC